MVSLNLTINLDDETAKLLEEKAKQSGVTVDALVARLVVDSTAPYDFTEEQEAELEASDAEIDRGEFVTAEALFEKLKAIRK